MWNRWLTIIDFIRFHSILKKNKNEWVNKLNKQIEFKSFLQCFKIRWCHTHLHWLFLRFGVVSSGPVSTWIKRNSELQVLLSLIMTTNANFPWVVKRNYVILFCGFIRIYQPQVAMCPHSPETETKTQNYNDSKKSWLLMYIHIDA